MCSACTNSSPAAVKSAAEQSARSLMLGLYAARRSTAPISSAAPVSREIRICSAAGSSGSALTRSRSRTITHAPSAAGSATQPSGTHTVQSGSITTSGPTTRGRSTTGSCPIVSGAARGRCARMATTSIAAPGRAYPFRRSCSAAKSAGRGTVTSWLCPRTGSRRTSRSARRYRPPPTPRAQLFHRAIEAGEGARRRPRPHELTARGDDTSPTAENTPAWAGR